ncbi:hypothetical protein ILUMI_23554 [Ignelater luminosus]|uniref:Uncharacterized protein n=1 Tax=Ignelater luminosus TaxID=2038154 RepID=A0A8K0G1S8_IGNLU|nr:hypothetical protein ILUMI_23554 [Ignelater luminosus]
MSSSQKLSCLLLVLACVTYTVQQLRDPAFMQKFQGYKEECSKEIGIDSAIVDKAWAENHFPNDEKLKCFFKCINMKFGVLTASGDVVDDELKKVSAQFVDAATDTEIVTECGAIQGADLCDTAMKLMACIKSATLD